MEHTSGPWSIRYLSGIDMEIVSENGKICHFSGLSHSVELMNEHESEEKANANLVAAAPDLLSALEEALPGIEELNGEFQEGWDSTIEKIEAAIKKARGL